MSNGLYRPDGTETIPAATAAKKAHDPTELDKETKRLNSLYQQWARAAVAELSRKDDEGRLVQPDHEAVIAHYSTFWREQAAILNRSGFPHKVPEDRLEQDLREWVAERERQELVQKPLHTVHRTVDMEAFRLWRLANHPHNGALYTNTHVAVAVDPGGLVIVWLRSPAMKLEEWAQYWANGDDWLLPVVQLPGYSLAQLNALVAAAGITSVSRIPLALITATAAPRQPWYKRLFQ